MIVPREREEVIVTAAVRLVSNPSQLPVVPDGLPLHQIVFGVASTVWTLAELAVLNRYRKRAM